MKTDMKRWVRSIIDSPQRAAFPILTHLGIELTGHTVYEAVTDAEIHSAAVTMLAERYPSVASSMIMDLTVEAEAFGAQVQFSENDVPNIIGRLVDDKTSIYALEVPSLDCGRVPQYIRANELIARHSSKPIVSGCIGPFSLAGRLFDMSEIMMSMYIEPDTVKVLLDKTTEFIISYCKALKEVGSNGVLIAEPAAGLLSNDAAMEFSSHYVRQIVEAVQDDYFAVLLHNCGNRGQCTSSMIATGAAGYHFGNQTDMFTALQQCPSDALVMGNLDPVALFKMADSQTIYERTMALLEECGSYSNFVLSSGCDVPPLSPIANVDAFYQAFNDFNIKLL